MKLGLKGVICPILTPFNDDGSLAEDLWVSHARWVLDQGAHFLSPFGTTGEALSLGLSERRHGLEVLIEGGIPPSRLMPGTGVTALVETKELTSHAIGLGCPAVMVLPSFFYTNAGDGGQGRYYADLIERVGDDQLRLILYNIPQNTGVPVTPGLTARLNALFPSTVVAYKDSSGDWNNTQAVITAAPDVAVFPGSESFLVHGLAAGAAGCISATVNLNAAAIRSVFEGAVAGTDVAAANDDIKAFRKTVQDAGLIGPMKAALAVRSGDQRWLNLRSPLQNATLEQGRALIEALGASADHLPNGR